MVTYHLNKKSKGVFVEVRPDELMPVDANGVRADAIMDPTSIPGY